MTKVKKEVISTLSVLYQLRNQDQPLPTCFVFVPVTRPPWMPCHCLVAALELQEAASQAL